MDSSTNHRAGAYVLADIGWRQQKEMIEEWMWDFLDAVASGDMAKALKIGCRNEGEQIDLFGELQAGGMWNDIQEEVR